jgi:hypothetical protein
MSGRGRGGPVLGVLGYPSQEKVPIKALGGMGRFFLFFEIPSVMLDELVCSHVRVAMAES